MYHALKKRIHSPVLHLHQQNANMSSLLRLLLAVSNGLFTRIAIFLARDITLKLNVEIHNDKL